MPYLKRVWSSERDAGLMTITLESEQPEIEHNQIRAHSMEFPAEPTAENPKRRTLALFPFDEDDINMLAQFLDTIRTDGNVVLEPFVGIMFSCSECGKLINKEKDEYGGVQDKLLCMDCFGKHNTWEGRVD